MERYVKYRIRWETMWVNEGEGKRLLFVSITQVPPCRFSLCVYYKNSKSISDYCMRHNIAAMCLCLVHSVGFGEGRCA